MSFHIPSVVDRRIAAFRRWILPQIRDPPSGYSWHKTVEQIKQELDDAVIRFINNDFSWPGYEDWDIY